MRPFEKPVGRSWRCDETYILVGGRWMYLYRAVDEHGRTVESHLSRTRDVTAAKAFFRRALKHHGQPRSITLDGFEPSHAALRRMGCGTSSTIAGRMRPDPNVSIPEHRRIKARLQPMLGFKAFSNARRVLIGIEFMQKIHKGQYDLTRT